MRNQIDLINKDVIAALKEVERKYGVKFSTGNARYTDNNYTVQLTVSKVTSTGAVLSPLVTDFKRDARLYGLEPTDLGKNIVMRDGTPATIIGLKSSSRRYPIVVETRGGKRYKLLASDVVKQLEKQRKPASPAKITVNSIETINTTTFGLPERLKNAKRKDQVMWLVQNGVTTPSEIATILGTNASYVARLIA